MAQSQIIRQFIGVSIITESTGCYLISILPPGANSQQKLVEDWTKTSIWIGGNSSEIGSGKLMAMTSTARSMY